MHSFIHRTLLIPKEIHALCNIIHIKTRLALNFSTSANVFIIIILMKFPLLCIQVANIVVSCKIYGLSQDLRELFIKLV